MKKWFYIRLFFPGPQFVTNELPDAAVLVEAEVAPNATVWDKDDMSPVVSHLVNVQDGPEIFGTAFHQFTHDARIPAGNVKRYPIGGGHEMTIREVTK